ncbi:PTS sugar transporter subunit IIC [Carnobacteriaceae bacterium zg-ZUI252]|nr:PTS sugar transporter subunit IIC [Carnobacteriaceae bacterium zg-ZUI252]MBS4769926.1 PTS sugar transporter subunit IIC [Carnobacteriaceae bacterium zg-ZUI240]
MKQKLITLLNGTSQGVVIALVPAAIFSEVFKLISQFFLPASAVVQMLQATNGLLGLAIGACVAHAFKLTMIEMISVGFATFLSGGALAYQQTGMTLRGTGDLLTMIATSAFCVILLNYTRRFISRYSLLMTPSLLVICGGIFGLTVLPYGQMITKSISEGIAFLLLLEQTTMCILLAIIFAYLVISPLSSAGIAIAVGLSGIGAGAANLGICATMFSLAVGGRQVNSLGVCLAHIFASPKLSMTNMMTKPILFLPIALQASILGGLASFFAIQGTPFSAGLGLIGLVGPIAHLSQTPLTVVNVMSVVVLFGVVPCVLAFIFDHIFKKRLNLIKDSDYAVHIAE